MDLEIPAGFSLPYLQRALKGKKDFRRDYDVKEDEEINSTARDSDDAYHSVIIDNPAKVNINEPKRGDVAHGEKTV